ncbi:sulfite reductase flavoprotein subunit alpha [Acinetobacter puyangensis]|uniref:Sulfite reductase (NADPH) flavoprotein alpha-component n=1 Tax=Acinetobacter puyangensis TaxID=1096779 RepID=A0A240EAE3_9GAMM|nr:sulfite reductase flavoprotein subunit alpha [Acinetobacter puyangensis]SNX44880.1 sulfite reductase (NADPH) flavoprotein alpha-component [Acinetobacter puyangensis]
MFKKTFFQIHWFLGITAGLILSLMGVTGAIYSYEQQILKWINQDSYIVEIQNKPKLSPNELYQHFIQQDPDLKINSITIAQATDASSTVNIVKEGERRGYNMMVNPYTAEVLPEIKGRAFFQFIQQLHRNLTVGPVGKQITGACTLMLIFFVLSGIYLRWPKKHSVRQWLFVKPKLKGRNFIWDLHAVVGTWVIVFYLIFAMTGLYWSYGWWRDGMFKVLGVERPQMMQGGPGGQRPQGQGGERPPAQGNNGDRQRPTNDSPQRGEAQGEQGVRAENPENAQRGEGRNASFGREQHNETAISSQQISHALSTAWVEFPEKVQRDYSSITFNLPKQADGKIELSFVDAIPQHERARNSATYDYQNSAIEKMELYADKKLNEKIMSSMLPVHRGSFMGPIYQFFAMLASLAMPLFFVTGWMLYLKRRKQKKLTKAARQQSNVVHLDANAEAWTILYASQTGTAEQIAYNTSSALQQAGVPTQVKALKDCSADDIRNDQRVLFVVSTYGTGDAPDLAVSFVKKYMAQTIPLDGLKYAVLALGSKEYPETYCTFGHRLNHWLKENQASPAFNLVEVDNSHKTDLERWYTALANITHKDVQVIINEKIFDDWQLVSRHLLNEGSLGEPAFEVMLKPLHDQSWHAGDIAEIQPGNSQQRIADFIEQHQLENNAATYEALRYKNLTQPINLQSDLEQQLLQLSDLPSREYSIASISNEGLLRLVVRQKQLADGLGLGSGWLTEYAEQGITLPARIRTNPSFHLIDDNRPALFIGNGTGIAGLLSLLKQREQLGFIQNWLIFGERQHSVDYFYRKQIELWQQTEHLQYVDLAFSRDQAQRIYVQDKLLEQQQRVIEWVERGAVIYICGSIDGMASSVEQALIDILGEEKLNELRQTDRYRRDVY